MSFELISSFIQTPLRQIQWRNRHTRQPTPARRHITRQPRRPPRRMKRRQVNPSEYTSKKTQKVPTPSPGCNAGTSSDLTCACRVCRYFLIRPKTYDAGASSNEKKEIFSLIAAADSINPINEINETYFCTRCRFYCFFSNSWVYFLYR